MQPMTDHTALRFSLPTLSRRGLRSALGAMLLALGLLPWSASAQPPGHGARHEARLEELSEQLTLTDEQEEQVRTILMDQRDKRQTLMQQYQEQTRTAQQTLKQQVEAMQEETNQRLASVLSEEQMASWKAWHEERRGRRGAGEYRRGNDGEYRRGSAEHPGPRHP